MTLGCDDDRCGVANAADELPIEVEAVCGNASCKVEVAATTRGLHQCSFTPSSTGFYRISVTSFGQHVRNSPLSMQVSLSTSSQSCLHIVHQRLQPCKRILIFASQTQNPDLPLSSLLYRLMYCFDTPLPAELLCGSMLNKCMRRPPHLLLSVEREQSLIRKEQIKLPCRSQILRVQTRQP